MSIAYRIMYRLNATPWDVSDPARDLRRLVEGEHALKPGTALDVGCGTGRDVVYLARHGWVVTGIDDVPLALRRARARADAAGVAVTLQRAEISSDRIEGRYNLVVDIGCLHNLSRAALQRAASTLDDVSAEGATLLSLAFEPGAPKPGPPGFTAEDLKAVLPAWSLVSNRYAEELPLKGRMRSARPHFYQLVKGVSRESLPTDSA